MPALVRFILPDGSPFPTFAAFDRLHCDPQPLTEVECDLKSLQVAYAPAGYELFLNVDQPPNRGCSII